MWHRDKKVGLFGLVLVCLAVTGFIMLWHTYQGDEDGYAAHRAAAPPEEETGIIPHQDQTSIPEQSPQRSGTPYPEQPPHQDQTQIPDPENQPEDTNDQPEETAGQPEESTGEPEETEEPEELLETIKDVQTREEWIEAKLEQYSDQIDEADVEDFRSIIGKLDMDHAVALLDNPDGAQGEEQLKTYLRSTLTTEEYGRAKELFFQYNYILFE